MAFIINKKFLEEMYMLIAIYMFCVTVVIPKCLVYLAVLFESAMIWFIMGAGMLMLLSAVGVRISNNMGSTIVVGIIMAIGELWFRPWGGFLET